jgi:ribosomal 50S subunit-associated protein YjgA (DUF615 family)
MTTKYVLFKDESFDDQTREMMGKVWVVHSEEDDNEEEMRWMSRTEAKRLAESLGYPFELEGSSMTDDELESFKLQQSQ